MVVCLSDLRLHRVSFPAPDCPMILATQGWKRLDLIDCWVA